MCFCAEEILFQSLLSNVPDITELYAKSDVSVPNITAKMLGVIREESKSAVSGCYTKSAMASVPSGKSETVNVVYTDNDYSKVYPLQMITGSFHLIIEPTVVIGGNLAAKLFIGSNIIGDSLNIGGTTYTVGGVYQDNNSFLSEISKGSDQIFVLNQDRQAQLTLISFAQGGSPYRCLSPLNKLAKTSLSSYYGVSLKEESNLAGLPRTVFWMILELAVFLLICAFSIRHFWNTSIRLRESFQKDYSLEVITKNWRYFTCQLILGLLSILLLITIISHLQLPQLPSEFIPNDNIFNISFYCEAIITKMQSQNSVMIPMYYPQYIKKVGFILLLYNVCLMNICMCAIWKQWQHFLYNFTRLHK